MNTGNRDFKYNDRFVDREDSYRHSKWLSFMHKRLELARNLLKPEGVIFISIDDNEQAQLKLLCDKVFAEENFVANIIWQKRTSPDSRKILGAAHDHVYTYCKDNSKKSLNLLSLTPEQELQFKNPDNDLNGPWVSSDFTAQGFRPNQMYKITTPGGAEYTPPEGRCWKNVESVYKQQFKAGRMWFGKDGKGIPRRKTYLLERKGAVPWTWWDNKYAGSNQDAKKELIDVLHNPTLFDTPKPLELIKKIITIATIPNALVLDFFAGSGTTLHAVMALNAEDGGKRQCILVTNNENNIAEEVCYERNRRVIEGYTNSKGVAVPGLTNNHLHYYQTAYVGRERTAVNKRELMRLATELLSIKEGCYNEVEQTAENIRLFTNDTQTNHVVVVYDEDAIADAVTVIHSITPAQALVKVYVFAPGFYPYTDDFEEVANRIDLVALPEAIYQAYARILPPAGKPVPIADDADPTTSSPTVDLSLFPLNA